MQLAKVLFILVAGAVASCEGADSSLRTSVKQAAQCAPPNCFYSASGKCICK
jgi:hypothetical protein